jgi:hypothetical protein
VSALFEFYVIAVFIQQRILNPKISMRPVRPIHGDLRLFGLTRAQRRDDFVDGSGHAHARVFRSSSEI